MSSIKYRRVFFQYKKGERKVRECRGRGEHRLRPGISTGFTIVELLIVVVIISIIASITIVAYNGAQTKAENTKTNQAVAQYAKALISYKTLNDTYPSPIGSFTCITGDTDYCANTAVNTAACFSLGRYQGLTSLDTAMKTIISSLPKPGGGGSCGGSTYAGIMYDGTRLIWFLRGTDTCQGLGGMYNPNTSASGGATRCYAYLP